MDRFFLNFNEHKCKAMSYDNFQVHVKYINHEQWVVTNPVWQPLSKSPKKNTKENMAC